ncbi:VOC family protein [Nonomuraea sp. NN258]|uniref:VOC family protein n=1 Tax=Nonomuraea antri TaxID=2730852 RepID=UPI0015699A95|nr:VOC family protein [Nonomuraea antri]NRQ37225.1 VOC family protein [Nonomuraea antri]
MATTISSVVIDCADPVALAAFYAKLTGAPVNQDDPTFVTLDTTPLPLAFQRVDGYRGPGWPNAGKHVHLDFAVDDPEAARQSLVEWGATVPEHQPGDGSWTVLVDPEGHPFCVMKG